MQSPAIYTLSQQDIEAISFDDIIEFPGFAHAKLLDIDIIIRKSDGWMNATKLCGTFVTDKGNPRRFYNWKNTDTAEELIIFVMKFYNIPKCYGPHDERTDQIISGSYVHPSLIVALATWCSSAFAVEVYVIVMNYNVAYQTQEKTRLLEQQRLQLEAKDSIIAERNSLITAKEQEITTLTNRISTLRIRSRAAISKMIVTTPNEADQNILAIIDLHNNTNDHYYVLRIQRGSLSTRFAEILEDDPNAAVLTTIITNYAVNTWKTAKANMIEDGEIKSNYNHVELLTISYDEFVDNIRSIDINNRDIHSSSTIASVVEAVQVDASADVSVNSDANSNIEA